MKTLVFSDSHGNTAYMAEAIRQERADRVLHLGDCVRDAVELERQFPGVNLNYVRGNCDGPAAVPDVMYPVLDGRRVLMTHGHLYHVKSDYGSILWAAKEAGADAVLFGHTHQAYCAQADGVWMLNPGSCRGWGPITYGVITLENGRFLCYIVTVPSEPLHPSFQSNQG